MSADGRFSQVSRVDKESDIKPAIAFSSSKRLGLITADGAEEIYPDLGKLIPSTNPHGAEADRQQSWQWGALSADAAGLLVTSFEETAIDRMVTGNVRTRIWRLDLSNGRLEPVLEGRRPAEFLTCASALPDGRRIVFLDCESQNDPAHFWADLCIVPASGEAVVEPAGQFDAAPKATFRQSHWFGTSHGPANHRGGGSNTASWSADGLAVTYTRKHLDSHPDCSYDSSLPDHQENVYRPDLARGGTQLCFLSDSGRAITEITEAREGRWDFRAAVDAKTGTLAFIRYRVGEPTELCCLDAAAGDRRSEPQRLTTGYQGNGCDHPKWVPGELAAALLRQPRLGRAFRRVPGSLPKRVV